MKNIFIIILILLINPILSQGQVMILKNRKQHKNTFFREGDHISVRLNDGEGTWKSGTIGAMDSSGFMLDGRKIELKTISILSFDRRNYGCGRNSGMIMLAGFLIPTVSVFNDVINGDKITLRPSQGIVASALMMTGIVTSILETRKCRIGEKFSLEILLV